MILHANELTVAISNKTICQRLTLLVNPGEMWGILGANGSGKTTLLHTLAGLRPPEAGNIWLNNHLLTQLSSRQVARQRALLFQESHTPFAQTVWDDCLAARFPHRRYFQAYCQEDESIVAQALARMALLPFKNKLTSQLSGGEKRRLAIARVLAQTPRLYLLDEPTNHLDIKHRVQLLNHFRTLASSQGAAIIMTLHDVNLVEQFCDHVLLLFTDGGTRQGQVADLLTIQHISALYQHPVKKLMADNISFWVI